MIRNSHFPHRRITGFPKEVPPWMQGRLGLRDRGGVETTQLITNCKDKGTESAFKMVQRRARPSLSQQHIKWDRDVLQAYIRAEEQRRVTSKTRNDVHTILSLQSPTKEHPYDVIRNNITRSCKERYKLNSTVHKYTVCMLGKTKFLSLPRTTTKSLKTRLGVYSSPLQKKKRKSKVGSL